MTLNMTVYNVTDKWVEILKHDCASRGGWAEVKGNDVEITGKGPMERMFELMSVGTRYGDYKVTLSSV